MKKFILLILLSFNVGLIYGQEVSHVDLHHKGDSIIISYDLHAEGHSDIRLLYSIDGGAHWSKPSENVSGDAGVYISPGTGKEIVWLPEGEIPLVESEQFRVRLKAKPFLEMVLVGGNTFLMGCTDEQPKCDQDEKPSHKITLRDYYIGKYEVTNAQYSVFLNEKGVGPNGRYERTAFIHIGNSHCQIRYRDGRFVPNPGKGDHPVVEVTWNGAQAFCRWMDGRLPTEAEWEYAARGGSNGKDYIYSGADTVRKVAWFDENSNGHAHPVGTKKANELGIYDMSGNVWEWCYDWYDDYPKDSKNNPRGPRRGSSVVVRGGSWLYYGSFCRVANRGSSAPGYAFNNYGFRVMIPE